MFFCFHLPCLVLNTPKLKNLPFLQTEASSNAWKFGFRLQRYGIFDTCPDSSAVQGANVLRSWRFFLLEIHRKISLKKYIEDGPLPVRNGEITIKSRVITLYPQLPIYFRPSIGVTTPGIRIVGAHLTL